MFQSAFTCSKLTIETLEQGLKYVQRHHTSVIDIVLLSLLLTLNLFHIFSCCFYYWLWTINVCWEPNKFNQDNFLDVSFKMAAMGPTKSSFQVGSNYSSTVFQTSMSAKSGDVIEMPPKIKYIPSVSIWASFNFPEYVLPVHWLYFRKTWFKKMIALTHSFSKHPFSTPWKHQKTVRFSDVFGG